MQNRNMFLIVGFILLSAGIALFQNCGATFKANDQTEQGNPPSVTPQDETTVVLKDELGELLSLPEVTVKPFSLPTTKDDNSSMRIATFLENCRTIEDAFADKKIFAFNRSKISAYYNVNFILREQLRFAADPQSTGSFSPWYKYQVSKILGLGFLTNYFDSIKKVLTDGVPIKVETDGVKGMLSQKTNGVEIHLLQSAPVTNALVYDTTYAIETSGDRIIVKKDEDYYFPPTVKTVVSTSRFDFDMRCLELDGASETTDISNLNNPADARIFRHHHSLKLQGDVLQGYVASSEHGGYQLPESRSYTQDKMDFKTWQVSYENGQLYAASGGQYTINGVAHRSVAETVKKSVRSLNTQTKCYDLVPEPGMIAYAKEDSLPGLIRNDAETCKKIRAGENIPFTPSYPDPAGIKNCESHYDAYLAALAYYKDRTVEPKLINMPACPVALD